MPTPLRIVDADEPGPRGASDIERAQRGDPGALARVLDAVGPTVLRAARSVLGPGHPDLEDVTQESLVGFVESLGRFRGECEVTTYASRIAARTALRWRRRGQELDRRRRVIQNQGEPVAPPDIDPRTWLAGRRKLALLRELLDDISPEQAEALVLRLALGHSLKEVALATGVPVNTVRSRIRRAKIALLERIHDDASHRELLEPNHDR